MDSISKTVWRNTFDEIKKYLKPSDSKLKTALKRPVVKKSFITFGVLLAAASLAVVLIPALGGRTVPPAVSESDIISVSDIIPINFVSESDYISDTDTSTTSTAETTTTAPTTTTSGTTVKDGDHINHEDVKDANYKSDYYIIVYTKNNTVRVLGKDEDGGYTRQVVNFLCSTAKSGKVTPSGVYSIDKRYKWRAMFGNVYAQYAVRFYGNYLFHSVPYLKEKPDTLEMEEYEKLGRTASLGCVRLCVRDAKWIYDCCSNGTQVRVISGKDGPSHSSTLGAPKLNYDAPFYGWDPSDPNPDNPYKHPEKYTTTTTESTTTTTESTTTTTEATTASTTSATASTTASTTASPTAPSTSASTDSTPPEGSE